MKFSEKLKTQKLKTKEFEYEGETVEIQELTGRQKLEAQKMVETPLEMSEFIWKNCVKNESLKMNHEEFVNAFDYCFEDIDHIIGQVLELSSVTVKASEELEKN